MIFVTRREVFASSHRLYRPDYSDEENLRVFGKCSNPNGHGHNYTLEVTVAGDVNTETGFVMDLKLLKKIIHEKIISKVDHKNLNLDVDFLSGKIPTTENIAQAIWDELENEIPAGKLYSVKLSETENNTIEIKGGLF